MPDVKIYIRQENLEAWNSIPKKSEWVNSQLSGQPVKSGREALGDYLPDKVTYAPIEPKPITKVPAQDTEAPKLKVMTNDDLKALLGSSGKKPIEAAPTHVCKDTCKHWVWDTGKGGRINTLTGEFQEGSPW